MKIKVDKEEYGRLIARVKQLEQDNNKLWKELFSTERRFRQTLSDSLDGYFTNKCRAVMIKRDRDVIVAEIRKQVTDNLFKVQEEE